MEHTYWQDEHITDDPDGNGYICWDESGGFLSLEETKPLARRALQKYANYLNHKQTTRGTHSMIHKNHFATQLLKPELTPEMFDKLPEKIQKDVAIGDRVLSYLVKHPEGGVEVKVISDRNLYLLDDMRYIEHAGVIPVFEAE